MNASRSTFAQQSTASNSLAASCGASGPGAVEAVCAAVIAALPGDPGLLLAFTSGEFDPDRSAAALQSAAPNAITAGISGKGVFSAEGPIEKGCAALAVDSSVAATIGVGEPAKSDLRGAGRDATEAALESLQPRDDNAIVLLLLDTGAGDIAEAIAGAYEVAGPGIRLAGGACGGPEPFQMAAGEGLAGAVVAIGVNTGQETGIGNAQTCDVIGAPSIVTRSEGQFIWEIDGSPAEQVYLERLGADGENLDDTAFAAMAITHPLSQPELHGNRRLRHVLGRAGEGGLHCATHIPNSAAVEFTELSRDGLIRSGWDSVGAALDEIGGGPARAGLIFDCAGRRKILGDAQADEVQAISHSFGTDAPPLAGLYTNGEVARVRGAKGDYNHAVVSIAFA